MNSLANVPIMESEEEQSNNIIDFGNGRKAYMTKGLYFDLMSRGQHDIIPHKWHERFYDDYYKWYQNEYNKYMNEMNPVLNRNNISGEFNMRKTSGRQARNKKAVFSGKKNKTARKAPNVFKNKRSKRRAQVLAPLGQLQNTIEAAYNNNTNNNSNLTDEQDVFIKMWAVNFLNDIILNSTSYSDFERQLEEPLSRGISHQPQSVRNNIKNTMLIPNTPLIDMFKATLYLTKGQLEKYKNTYLSGSYDYKPLYKQLDQNSNNDSISLIDVKTIKFYYAGYYFPNAILAAMSKNNLEIFNKILEFNPRIDNSIVRDLFYGVINDYSTEINPEILSVILSKIGTVENHILSRVVRLQKRWLLEALIDNKKIDTDEMYKFLFENIRKNRLMEIDIRYAIFVIELFKEKNIKPSPGIFEDEFIYLLNTRPFITRSDHFYDRAPLYRLFTEMLPEINVNKLIPSDPEGNTIFMAMIRSHWNFGPDAPEVIEMVVTRPDFNPNKTNQLGETPLAIAIKLNKSNIAQRLMRIPGAHLEAKNIYGRSPMNYLKMGVAPNLGVPTPVAVAAPLNEWNNFNNVARGRTTRRNNYRNMMRTYERTIKPRVAMTLGAKKVYVPDPKTGYRKPVNLGPNLARSITSFIPSAATNQ